MEYDDIIDDYEEGSVEQPLEQQQEEIIAQPEIEQDLISSLLKDRGIEDKNSISFEDEDGSTIFRSWDDLSVEEQLNIFRSTTPEAESGLDVSEIQLINSIRSNNLTPEQYINQIQTQAVENYKKSSPNVKYIVDDYNDDELFVYDLLDKISDLTEEEAVEALDKAKSNMTLFNKQITAIRNSRKEMEDNQAKQLQFEQEQKAAEDYQNFCRTMYNEIANFNSIGDGQLNLSPDDRQNLYEFITGSDETGTPWFSKALNEPETVMKMAWFALNGEQTLKDIQNYYNSEIKKIISNYESKLKQNPQSIYKPKSQTSINQYDYDLNDF